MITVGRLLTVWPFLEPHIIGTEQGVMAARAIDWLACHGPPDQGLDAAIEDYGRDVSSAIGDLTASMPAIQAAVTAAAREIELAVTAAGVIDAGLGGDAAASSAGSPSGGSES